MEAKPMPHEIKAEAIPDTLRICAEAEPITLDLTAQSADGKEKTPTFQGVGYTGGLLQLGWGAPVVIDLEGMKVPNQRMPALLSHDTSRIVGHTESVEITPKRLYVSGSLSKIGDAAAEVIGRGKEQFPWQMSVGANINAPPEFIPRGESAKANGRNFDGPVHVVRKSTLGEISFVAIGADMATSATVSAAANLNKGPNMNPEFLAWLKANEYTDAEAAALTGKKLSTLQAAWEASKSPAPKPEATPATLPISASQSTFDQKMAAIEAESARIQYIQERSAAAAESHTGNPQKIAEIRELCASAVADKSIDARAFDLALLRADRAMAPTIWTQTEKPVNENVIAAAICTTGRLPNVEKQFDERTLTAAHSHFKRGISLRDLLSLAAQRNNNYRGSSRDDVALCRAAFDIRAEGPSTIAVPGILSNVANKFLAAGFYYTEQSWRQISKIKTANDFKQMSTYRLTGSNKFKKVAPGGEIKHGTLSELSYTNQVDTYGILIGMDRRDIRNDDLGAFTSIPQELGRGGGDSLNEIFWTEYLDDSAFYPTDKSLLNYDDGATDSVLSLAGLDNADSLFALQTKPDGTPLGVMPKILLVPRSLYATAKNLMAGMVTASAQSTATVTVANVWQGMFDVVSSVYLQSSAITGYSATAWYLLADPQNIATIEVAFLDGVETPTVESSEFEFDRLGLSMRAFMDWGCNKQEYRGGIKLKGAA